MTALAALLLALIAAATGIDRAVDPGLTAIAERRVVEVQADFSHAGADPCCPLEVLAWNSGKPDPIASVVHQWRNSPGHWAILTNPALTAIGCAVAQVDVRVFAVCVLATIEQPAPGPAEAEANSGGGETDPSSAPSTSATSPPAPLPDTSMGAP